MANTKSKDWIAAVAFLSPMLLGIIFIYYYPMVQAFVYSMNRTNGIQLGAWVGFNNYVRVLKDQQFWSSMYNTLYMGIITVVLHTAVPFVLATLINNTSRTQKFFKSAFFIPNIISVVAATMLFKLIFYPTKEGLINYFLGFLGVPAQQWFADPNQSRLTICLMGLWRGVGYNTIIFIAGLQSVPNELYEAAKVDGCSPFKLWRRITIPLVRPVIMFVIIMDIISSMRRFSDVWMIGGVGGSPGGSLSTAVVYIYRYAFSSNEMGVGCAAAFLLFIGILLLTVASNKLGNKRLDI